MKIYIYLLILAANFRVFSQTYTIEQYLNIRGATNPQYSHDDKRVYFLQSVTGTQQLWMLENGNGWPFQITFYNERISGYSVNPVKDYILVRKDEGGSEYNQFYLLNGIGSDIRLITDNQPKVLYGFGRWSDNGEFFSYYSNKRSPRFYDIYIYDLSSASHKMVYSSDHSNFPSIISPDGKKMVISRSYNTYDNDLFILDIASGSLRLITLHDNLNDPSEFTAHSYSADGKKIFITTNLKNDFYRIAVYDIERDKLEFPEYDFLNDYRNKDISTLYFSNDKKYMCVIVNDNGYDRLFVYDLLKNRLIDIPDKLNSSSITALRFSGKSDRLIIGINSASTPSSLFEWALNTGNVIQLTYPTLSGIEPDSFVEPVLISYKSFDGLEIPAFYYKPVNVKENEKLPCIISIHGGPEGQAVYGFEPVFQYFVNAGYAVVEPNVRGSTGYGKKYAALDNVYLKENAVRDIASLYHYLISECNIDPDKVALYGASYGGYMVLASLAMYPELYAAGIDIVGISDFVTFLRNTADYRRSNRESEYGSLENDLGFLQSISPLNKVKNIRAPVMLVHGRNDPRVPVSEAEQMYRALITNDVYAELIIYDDEGHGISKLKNRLDLYPRIVRFLDTYLKNK